MVSCNKAQCAGNGRTIVKHRNAVEGHHRNALRISLSTSTDCVAPLAKGAAIAFEARLAVNLDKLTEFAIIKLNEYYNSLHRITGIAAMFKSITTTLITGFITLVPIVLTLYFLYWLALTSEQVLGAALQFVLPKIVYFPGLGSIAGLVVIFLVGLLMKAVFIRQVFALGEQLLYHLPIIKTVYRAMRDLLDFFSPNKDSFGGVVIVNFNGMEVIGFVTQEDSSRLPESFRDRDSVLVYIPMSYMIGGFTLLIPRQDIKPCSMSADEAMRFVLTAGITGTHTSQKETPSNR